METAWTLADAWESYKRELSSKACFESDRGTWGKHIAPFLGAYRLTDIKNQQISELRRRLEAKPITPQTVKHLTSRKNVTMEGAYSI